MNAPAQLEMFDPDAVEASALLIKYLALADRAAAAADRFDLLAMAGAAATADRQAQHAVDAAFHVAVYLDFLEVAA
jgi:hypothetical protein